MFQSEDPNRRKTPRMSDIAPPRRQRVSTWPPEPLQKNPEWYLPAQNVRESGRREGGSYNPSFERKSEARGSMPARKIIVGVCVCVLLFGAVWLVLRTGQAMKEDALRNGEAGYADLTDGAESMRTEQFAQALSQFNRANQEFGTAGKNMEFWGSSLIDLTRFIPGVSQLSAGKRIIDAGKHFATAGVSLSQVAADASISKDAYAQGEKISFLDLLTRIKGPLARATGELQKADQDLSGVNTSDIPEENRGKFVLVKENLPVLSGLLTSFEQHAPLVEELLGGNGPRKYLFLLQNNHELRATGGFIGSYGLLDVNNGVVRRFFVDGIFNPDGQLKENIIPPKPIQKVSAAWSLHDSNWFPDFPTSAEKAIFFYEKTGGPTVDGIITLTPTVMQKLLVVIGPIALPKYGLTVDADNFIPVIQEQVEVKYDKTENEPKKVLADLSAALLEKVFASQDKTTLYGIAQALLAGLNEKHILLYARHAETEALIDQAGWSGRLLPASKDYLSVVHTNINGFKTDGIIDETIQHKALIDVDGSIIDTVTITRTHNGGNTPYEWWNKVNADYLRVYVPEGSELLSAKGATWEFPLAPLDYAALGFKKDEEIRSEEENTTIDEKSGTRISRESGKTVFGAWVYVSPQERVTVEYRYRLPFRIDVNGMRQGNPDSYAALYQKQSGSIGSTLETVVDYPEGWKPIWQTGINLVPYGRELKLASDLKTDKFTGVVFGIDK